MSRTRDRLAALLGAVLFASSLMFSMACEEEGPFEEAGEELDEAAEEAADEMEDAVD